MSFNGRPVLSDVPEYQQAILGFIVVAVQALCNTLLSSSSE